MTDHIFISYSKIDSDFAHKLADDLIVAGFKIWIDCSIGGGEQWRETIEKNLKTAGEVIIVVSPNSMASEWVKHEGSLAYGWEKKLYPILIDPVESLPPWLDEYQWIDFVNTSYKIAFDALVTALTPPNPIQDLLDQQVYAYEQTGELIGEALLRVIYEGRKDLKTSTVAAELIRKSKKTHERTYQRRKRRNRILLVVSLVAGALAIIATIFGLQFRTQARTARAGQLATLALNKLESEHDLALLLSLEAISLRDSAFSRDSLLTCVEHNPNLLRILQGHRGAVNSVAFNPDGDILVSGSSDGTFRFWDPYTGEQIGEPLSNSDGGIYSLAFSPDGDLLASGSDSDIIVWDYRKRKQLYRFSIDENKNEYGPVTGLVFNPGGELLAGGYADVTTRIWNLDSGILEKKFLYDDYRPVINIAFIQEGQVLVSSGSLGQVYSHYIDSGNPLESNLYGYYLTVSPNGNYFAGSDVDDIQLWDLDTGNQIGEPLTGHMDWIRTLTFSPDNQMLASGSEDATIRLWDIHAKEEIGHLTTGHNGSINSIVFSPNGDLLVSGGEDGTIRVWVPPIEGKDQELLASRHIRQLLADLPNYLSGLAFGCVGNREKATHECTQVVASGSGDSRIRLWDPTTRKQIGDPFGENTGKYVSVAINPAGALLASGDCDGSIRFWDPMTHQPKGKIVVGDEDECVYKMAFSPDGQYLACIHGIGGIVSLWDLNSGQDITQLYNSNSAGDIIFSPNGEWIAGSAGEYQSNFISFRIWDLDSREQIVELNTDHMLYSIVYSPSGNDLVSGDGDGAIRFRDPNTGDEIGEKIIAHTDFVSSLCFSPNGQFLASGGADGAVKLWDPESGQQIGEILAIHEESMWTQVDFSTDNNWMASAGEDGKIYLYDMNIESWKEKACELAGRNLNLTEWQVYFPNEKYRITCPQWPTGE